MTAAAPKTTKAPKVSPVAGIAKGLARNLVLFGDLEGEAFAALDGIAYPIESNKVRWHIRRHAFEQKGLALSKHQVAEIAALLEMHALGATPRSTHVRIAAADGATWLDLGRDEAPTFARVTVDGWSLESAAPVMFQRPAGMKPLPIPEHGGSLEELRELLAFAGDSDAWILSSAWLVGALQVGAPYAILAFTDQQGRGKTVRARILRNIVDPNALDVERPPRTTDDLLVAACSVHVIVLDNLSSLPEWLADDLCVVATGGGTRKRKLYSGKETTIVQVMKPLILTGISEISRSDLASRCLRIELGPLAVRRTEAELNAVFDAAQPRILGALLDAAACAMRRVPEVKIDELPRMADFTRWATAAEPALGLPDGSVLAAIRRADLAGATERAEGSPLQKLLDELVQDGPWKGTPAQTYDRLYEIRETLRSAGKLPDDRRFPASTNALSSQLRRSAPDLRQVGFVIDLDGSEGRDKAKHKVWTIDYVPEELETPEAGSMGAEGVAAE